jgi:hypothetical protein
MSGKRKSTLSPWQKIVRASKKGKGLRLTADEVFQLACDDTIATLAQNDDEASKP